MTFWDEQFSAPGYKYGSAPNAFLVQQATRLAPGSRVLVPGDGEGRNGVWLAGQGHRVTCADQSAVGLAKACALAAERGVALATEVIDLAEWSPAPGVWDGVVLTYVHLPAAWRAKAHARLAHGLRPGGVLILECFHPAQLGRASGGPKDVTMLVTLDQLRQDFAAPLAGPLEEILGWEGEVVLDEGPGHQGPAMVTRYVGRHRGEDQGM